MSVDRCVEFIEENRLLPCGIARPNYSLDWCIAMYNMGVSISALAEAGVGDVRAFHAMSEAAAGVRYLAYYQVSELDFVDQQLLKRLFWLLFAGARCVMLSLIL